MNRDTQIHNDLRGWLLAPLLVGSAAALTGGYWDDAWHTERGRDEFFIAPHIAIYGGIALAGAALSVWVLLALRAGGTARVIAHRPLLLAVLGVAATLASGPIDNTWHVLFGRDAVIWSPPHTLGIVGTAALGVALLVEVSRSRAGWAKAVRPAAGAFVVAALTFLVVEYETDVPQFDALWYLPVLGITSALALALARRVSPARWAASEVAAVHLAFVAAVSVILLALGFDSPKLPLLLAPALVLDLGMRRAFPLAGQALLYTAALFALYVPSLNWLQQGVEVGAADVALGFPIALAGVAAALFVVLGEPRVPRPSRLASTAVVGAALLLGLPAGAFAHDPGQGKDAGSVALRARTDGRAISLDATARPNLCARAGTGRLVVRRAGLSRDVGMRRSGCRYHGRISVQQRGRWFVYAQLERGDATIESWLPVKLDGGETLTADATRYAYVARDDKYGKAKTVAGVVLYLLMFGLLAGVVALVLGETAAQGATA